MKKTFCPIFVIIVCLICISCKQENNGSLIHTVSDFNVPISCISPSGKSGIYYTGLENGNIVVSNIIDNSQTVINAGNNRIYDIYEENDTTLLVGVRQEGVKIIINGRKKKYNIPHPRDTTKSTSTDDYAPYSIKEDKENYYFATSSGIYRLSKNEVLENDSNDTLLHEYYRPENQPYYHFGTYLLSINDSTIYAATDAGLLVMKKDTPRINKLLTEKIILHFYKSKDTNDTLYATSSDSLYAIDMRQQMMQQKATPVKDGHTDMFAYIKRQGSEWTVNATKVTYEDSNGTASLDLPDKLSSNYKNFICNKDSFVLVACYNKLFGFSFHQNPKSHNVIAAANKGTNGLFFITMDNTLYWLGKDEVQAHFKGKLNYAIEKPIKFYAGKEYLWLITNNSLYRIHPEGAHTRHEIGEGAQKNLGSKIDFRSIYVDSDSIIYLGSRYYLFKVVYKNDTIACIDSIRTKEGPMVDSDLYVTDIHINKSGEYFATLKHGIYRRDLEENLLYKVVNSDTIGVIKRFISRSNDESYLNTSKGVYKWVNDSCFYKLNISPESILTVYFRDEGGFFVIGYRGLNKMEKRDENTSFDFVSSNLDILVNEAAITLVEKTDDLYVGSKTGLYKFDGELHPIIIPEEPMPLWQKAVIFIVAITAIVAIFLFYTAYYKNELKKIEKVVEWHKCLIKKELEEFKNRNNRETTNTVKLEAIESDLQSVTTITSSLKALQDLTDNFIYQIHTLETKKDGLETGYQNLTKQQDASSEEIKKLNEFIEQQKGELSKKEDDFFSSIRAFLTSMVEGLRKYANLLSDSQKEAMGKIRETNDIDSVPESLEQLKSLLNELHERFAAYIYKADKLPPEMVDDLKKIFENKQALDNYIKDLKDRGEILTVVVSKDDFDKIERQERKAKLSFFQDESTSFFETYSDYLGKCNWLPTVKAVACCYLYKHNEKIRSQDVEILLHGGINNRRASDFREKINSDLGAIEPRNNVLELLFKKTLSQKKEEEKENNGKLSDILGKSE